MKPIMVLDQKIDFMGFKRSLIYRAKGAAEGAPEPYVITRGFDERTGEWDSGEYFRTEAAAREAFAAISL